MFFLTKKISAFSVSYPFSSIARDISPLISPPPPPGANRRSLQVKNICTIMVTLFIIGNVFDLSWLKGDDQILNCIMI